MPASTTRAYTIVGDFTSVDTGGADGAIILNQNLGTPLFSAEVDPGTPQPFSLTVTVNAGDTIDFRVGYGTDPTSLLSSPV